MTDSPLGARLRFEHWGYHQFSLSWGLRSRGRQAVNRQNVKLIKIRSDSNKHEDRDFTTGGNKDFKSGAGGSTKDVGTKEGFSEGLIFGLHYKWGQGGEYVKDGEKKIFPVAESTRKRPCRRNERDVFKTVPGARRAWVRSARDDVVKVRRGHITEALQAGARRLKFIQRAAEGNYKD